LGLVDSESSDGDITLDVFNNLLASINLIEGAEKLVIGSNLLSFDGFNVIGNMGGSFDIDDLSG
jgi:hypothetical protein